MSITGLKKDEYDAIIIGAGIGGLVCGCYLAKAGMKVLIVEKNDKPGGYCTSFEKDGYRFDACAHGIGSMYEGGNLRKIIKELELDLNITRFDPSDIIISPDYKICFWNDINKTIYDFQSKFPDEGKNIEAFFNFINKTTSIELFAKLRHKTFKNLLDEYFKNKKLKAILGFLLGNLGVSSSAASAFIIAILYKEFMINGGYYPVGGMQAVPDSLSKKFKEFGGEIWFSKKVEKIEINNNIAMGISVEKNSLRSRFVISNCDIMQTYFKLIGEEYLNNELKNSLAKKVMSPSALIVYLGLKNNVKSYFAEKSYAAWYMPTYDLESIYLHNDDSNDINFNEKDVFLALGNFNSVQQQNHTNKTMHLLIIAPFKDEKFWEENKYKLADDLIKRGQNLIPSIERDIAIKHIATPIDFFNYSGNCKGSAYGWASVEDNAAYLGRPIKNFYIVGHWSSSRFGCGGINTVALISYSTSQTIINKWIKK